MYLIKLAFVYHLLLLLFSNANAQNDHVKQIGELMNAAHQIGIFNGNVLVAEKGKIIYRSAIGYADGAKTKMLSPNMRFDIGSISKEFNGVGIMMLKEQGKLKLDDKVSKYLPQLPRWADKIQIKNLIQYTSGLPVGKANTDEEYENEIAKLEKPGFEPGTAFIYSNANVYLQKRIIEKITGVAYKTFVETRILTPCKMTRAMVDLPTGDPSMARAFDNNFVGSKYVPESTGWVYLTMDDLYQWANCLHSYRILNKQSFEELAEGFGDTETSLGGAEFENNELILHQHQGSSYNYEALMMSDLPDDITVILLTNNQNFKLFELSDSIKAILRDRPYKLPKKSN